MNEITSILEDLGNCPTIIFNLNLEYFTGFVWEKPFPPSCTWLVCKVSPFVAQRKTRKGQSPMRKRRGKGERKTGVGTLRGERVEIQQRKTSRNKAVK